MLLLQGHQQHSGREPGAQGAHAEPRQHPKVASPGAGDQQHARGRAARATGQRLRAAVGAPAAWLCRPGRPPGILPSAPAGGHHCSDSVAVACAEHALHCGSVRQLRMQDVDLPPSAYYAGAAGHHHRTSSGAWAAVLHHCGHAIASHCRERLGLPLNRSASRSCRVGPSLTAGCCSCAVSPILLKSNTGITCAAWC